MNPGVGWILKSFFLGKISVVAGYAYFLFAGRLNLSFSNVIPLIDRLGFARNESDILDHSEAGFIREENQEIAMRINTVMVLFAV